VPFASFVVNSLRAVLPLVLAFLTVTLSAIRAADIISTGTPGAVVIRDGDTAECRIEGLGRLANPVRGPGHR